MLCCTIGTVIVEKEKKGLNMPKVEANILDTDPIFLTKKLVEESMDHVIHGMMYHDSVFGDDLRRTGFHAVLHLLVKGTSRFELYFEKSYLGDPRSWPGRYDEIARSKATMIAEGRHDGRIGAMSHLLHRGDTQYWGGRKRENIICCCSGENPLYDRLASGMIIDVCVARADYAFEVAKATGEMGHFL